MPGAKHEEKKVKNQNKQSEPKVERVLRRIKEINGASDKPIEHIKKVQRGKSQPKVNVLSKSRSYQSYSEFFFSSAYASPE